MVNERFGCLCPPMVAIGVVKASENLGDADYKTGDPDKKKYALNSRADRADKRAFSRFIGRYGYAAPDTRNYGGVTVNANGDDETTKKETIEGEYQVIGGVTVEDPEPTPPAQAEAPVSSGDGSNHAQREAALGRAEAEPGPDITTRAGAIEAMSLVAKKCVEMVSTLSAANHETEASALDKLIAEARKAKADKATTIEQLNALAESLGVALAESTALLEPAAETTAF